MNRQRTLKLVICVLVCSATMALAQTFVAQIPLGTNTGNIAVNPITNRVYVTNSNQGSVSVIDGFTRSVVTTIFTGIPLVQAVAIDWETDRIYVTCDNFFTGDASVAVIDGRTNQIVDTIFVSNGSFLGLPSIAANPFTHRIYVADTNNGAVAVISGTKNAIIASIPIGFEPLGVAVNFITDMIYTNMNSPIGRMFAISGRTNQVVQSIPIGGFPIQIVADVRDNRIFAEALGSTFPTLTNPGIYVVNGTTNKVVGLIPEPSTGASFDVNPFTDRLWVIANGTVSLINARTNVLRSSLTLGGNLQAIAVNPITNTAYVLKLGVVDVISGGSKEREDGD